MSPGAQAALSDAGVGWVDESGAASTDGTATWRNDDRAQRILVSQGPADDATAIGFELLSAAAAGEVAGRLAALGYPVEVGSDADCAARQVQGLWRTVAPWGVPVEIVYGMAAAPGEAFVSPLMPGGFKTDGVHDPSRVSGRGRLRCS